ncbi:unnamed protein product [Arctia plantaginis]|uniref:Uncharacterized protein n=1 Tax=Arctia plantaginis TaxID=874455 RepID=A0A8S1B964_ARCPL|nr:unnamed protein product [Arctia plantaginis]
MFKPEEQQVQICLLKSHLEEIENDLVLQHSALPALDAENERKYRETMTALKVARSLNIEIERLKLENVRLTAKRMQLKRQSDDLSKSIEKARATQSELTELLKKEEQETKLQVPVETNSVAIHAGLSPVNSHRCAQDKEEVNKETEKINIVTLKLENLLQKRQIIIDELKQQLNMLQPDIPEDILELFLKKDLDTQVKELTEKYEGLLQKRNLIADKKNDGA